MKKSESLLIDHKSRMKNANQKMEQFSKNIKGKGIKSQIIIKINNDGEVKSNQIQVNRNSLEGACSPLSISPSQQSFPMRVEQQDGLKSEKYLFIAKLSQGLKLYSGDLIEEALQEFQEAEAFLNFLPCFYAAIIHYNISCCLHRLGKVLECIIYLKKAIQSLEDQNSYNYHSEETRYESIQKKYYYENDSYTCETLNKQRLLTKIILQLCAIMSQTNDHEEALRLSERAEKSVFKMMRTTMKLCDKYSEWCMGLRGIQKAQESDDDYTPIANNAILRKNKSGELDIESHRRKSENRDQQQYSARRVGNQSGSNLIESSFISNATSNAKLKFDRRLSKSGSRKLPEDLSLERIHTFHLKKSPIKGGDRNQGDPIINIHPIPIMEHKQHATLQSRNIESRLSQFSKRSQKVEQNPLIAEDRAFYIQECTVPYHDAFLRNIMPVLEELIRLLQKDANTYPRLKSFFKNDQDIETLKANQKFKQCLRSILGLPRSSLSQINQASGKSTGRMSQKDDQWIYHLNIGNVMQLIPMTSRELERLGGVTTQIDQNSNQKFLASPERDLENGASQSTLLNSYPREFEKRSSMSKEFIMKVRVEISRNQILDKIILIVVMLFCQGTELRFKSQALLNKEGPLSDAYLNTRELSERYHANSIHLAVTFLPDECPLVGHMINSYKKHHMKNRAVLQSQRDTFQAPNPLLQDQINEQLIENEMTTEKVKRKSLNSLTERKNSDINIKGNMLPQKNQNPQNTIQIDLIALNRETFTPVLQGDIKTNRNKPHKKAAFRTAMTPSMIQQKGNFQNKKSPVQKVQVSQNQVMTRSIPGIQKTTKNRSPREQNPKMFELSEKPNPSFQLFPIKLLHNSPSFAQFQADILNKSKKKDSKEPKHDSLDQSDMMMNVGEDVFMQSVDGFDHLLSKRQAVRREFGMIKKPMDIPRDPKQINASSPRGQYMKTCSSNLDDTQIQMTGGSGEESINKIQVLTKYKSQGNLQLEELLKQFKLQSNLHV